MKMSRLSGHIKSVVRKINTVKINRKISGLNRTPDQSAPLFSVVIPIYDRVAEVREAIESILAQSFKNYELLLVCDGSPPATRSLVDSYSGHSQIQIYHFDDSSGNACRGRNKGIRMARGSYVAFLDSDDIAMPLRLEKSLFHFLDKKVEVVGGAIEYLVTDKNIRGFADGQVGFTSEECNYQMLQKGNLLSTCTVAVARDMLMQYGGFREEMRYREDHELWLRLAYHGCKIFNSPEILAKYRVHSGNAEITYLEEDNYWFENALMKHKEDFLWSDIR